MKLSKMKGLHGSADLNEPLRSAVTDILNTATEKDIGSMTYFMYSVRCLRSMTHLEKMLNGLDAIEDDLPHDYC